MKPRINRPLWFIGSDRPYKGVPSPVLWCCCHGMFSWGAESGVGPNQGSENIFEPFSPAKVSSILPSTHGTNLFHFVQAVSEMPWIIGHRIAVKLLAAVCLPAVGYLGSYLHIYSMDGQQRLLCFTPKTAAGIHTASHRHRWRGNPSADNPP